MSNLPKGIDMLPSGAYRLRKQIKGKTHTVTFDHKPTKTEIDDAIYELRSTASDFSENGTFKQYAIRYVDTKENVLSPSTVRLYKGFTKNVDETFLSMELKKITGEDIQSLINDYTVTHSPKTVRNLHGFISAVMKMYRPNFTWNITLPQKIKVKYNPPTAKEVKAVLEKAKGTEYEIVLGLGTYGLRRSEAIAVTPDKIDKNNNLLVDTAIVINKDSHYVTKTTKTDESTRVIPITKDLAKMIRKQGYAYNGHPNNIVKALHRFQDEANVQHFRYHDLRHFFATELAKKFTDKDVMYLGGWKTDYTMKKVYQHARAEKDAKIRKQAMDSINDALS